VPCAPVRRVPDMISRPRIIRYVPASIAFFAALGRADGRRLVFVQALFAVTYGLLAFLAPWSLIQAGVPTGLAIMATAAGYLGYALAAMPAGLIADGGRARRSLILVTSTAAIGVGALAAMPLWAPAVVVALALAGTGRALIEAVILTELTHISRRRRAISAQATAATGQVLGVALGPLLVSVVGLREAMAAAVLFLLLAIPLALRLKTGRSPRRRPDARVHLRDVRGKLARTPALRALLLAGVIWGMATGTLFALLAPLVAQRAGIPRMEAYLLLGLVAIAALLATPLARALDHFRGDRFALLALLAALGAGLILLGLPEPAALTLVVIAISFLIQATGAGVIAGARARRTPDRMQATLGLVGRMLLNLGAAGGILLSAAVAALLGLLWAYGIIGAITLVGALALARTTRRLPDGPLPRDGIDEWTSPGATQRRPTAYTHTRTRR